MTLYGSVIGAGLLLSQQAGMPLPPEQRAPATWQPWLRNGGGSRKELELRETPSLLPCCFHEDVGRPTDQRDPGQDYTVHGPLGEGFARGPGGGLQGRRVHQEGRATSSGKEEDEAVAQSYHDMVLSGKL